MRGAKFEGTPCQRCGSTVRYVSCLQCVNCAVSNSTKRQRQAAEKRAKRYHGKPCRTCGGTERYISNNTCCACIDASNKSRRTLRQQFRNH